MLKILATIAALLLLTGCGRFDEAKEHAKCKKAHPNDEVAADKCLEIATQKWANANSWLPRVVDRKPEMP